MLAMVVLFLFVVFLLVLECFEGLHDQTIKDICRIEQIELLLEPVQSSEIDQLMDRLGGDTSNANEDQANRVDRKKRRRRRLLNNFFDFLALVLSKLEPISCSIKINSFDFLLFSLFGFWLNLLTC